MIRFTETNEIIKNDNGTYSHRYDAKRQWSDRNSCATDLRFTKEFMK